MSKYGAEVQEKAYELYMVQQLSFLDTLKKMREEYPKFSKGTLTKWKNDPVLEWEGRYAKYARELAEKNDIERAKKITPILHTIQDIREQVYLKLIDFLEKSDVITDKNIGHVLSSFVKMGELEYKMTGGTQSGTPVKQVINVLLMVIEKNPNVGPVFKAYKSEIENSVFKMIQGLE